jgi:uncharacterized protein YecT (DUF1311 family)
MLTNRTQNKIGLLTLIPSLGMATAITMGAIAPMQAQPIDCKNAVTQSDMNHCAYVSWQKADQTLNQVYQSLTAKLSAARREQLTTVQLDWITFRDRECEFVSGVAEGGSIQPLLTAGCWNQLTIQRTTDLKAYLQGKNPPAPAGDYQKIDAELNQRYQQVKQDQTARQRQRLETASLAWIQWRDRVCDFERAAGGKAASLACLKRLTAERIQQFKNYADW